MGLRESIFQDTVADLSVRRPIVVQPTTTVRQAAAQMRLRQLGCALVVDAEHRPVGKFTQRQLMRLLLDNPAGVDQPVSKFMYPDADAIRQDQPIADLVRLMSGKQIRYLAVMDAAGRVVGLTGQKGLMEYIADNFPRQVRVQRMKPLIGMEHREGA